jgi:hypothetical protein
MVRRVRLEAPYGLLELPLIPRPISAAGVIPGDGHVDEPLEEVALVRLRRAPDVFQHLVRGEVLAAVDELEPALELVPFRGGL